MSKEFISDTVLDDRALCSTQTSFSGDLQGIRLSQVSDDVATIGQIAGAQSVIEGLANAAMTIGEEILVGAWVYLGNQGEEAIATVDQTLVSVAADLTDLNRRDVCNTLEFASRYADSLIPKGEDSATWSWFHNYISAIPKLGWTKHTDGPQDVDLKQMPASVSTVADLIVGIANADSTFSLIQRQLIQRTMNAMMLAAATGVMGLFDKLGTGSITEVSKSFSVTAACIKDGVLTMRTVGVEFRSTESGTSSSQSVTKEIFDFTADQSFLDAHRKDVEQRLQESAGKYIDSTQLD
ncbi:hypothetical protein BD779DRAFT_1179834 [Infundibulicybe gibba]|nr:hypothetical protein BD779DRAFT_1179834 [Infundibulicybe gibba]